MTITIILSLYSDSANFIGGLFNLVSKIVHFPFQSFTNQITRERLFTSYYTGSNDCRCHHTILITGFGLASPLTSEVKYIRTWK